MCKNRWMEPVTEQLLHSVTLGNDDNREMSHDKQTNWRWYQQDWINDVRTTRLRRHHRRCCIDRCGLGTPELDGLADVLSQHLNDRRHHGRTHRSSGVWPGRWTHQWFDHGRRLWPRSRRCFVIRQGDRWWRRWWVSTNNRWRCCSITRDLSTRSCRSHRPPLGSFLLLFLLLILLFRHLKHTSHIRLLLNWIIMPRPHRVAALGTIIIVC